MSVVRIALAQAAPVLGDKGANLAKAERFMQQAAQRGAHAIVFPEMFLTGYMVEERAGELAEPLDGPSVRQLAAWAARHGLLAVCGFPERAPDGSVYNAACVIDRDGRVLGSYRKCHMFGGEEAYFRPGDALPVFATSLGTVGVMICYDLEFPEVARCLALQGAVLLLVATANMHPYEDYQRVYVRARAMENGCFVAVANQVGADHRYRYFGESAVAAPSGRVVAVGGGEEALVVGDADMAEVPPRDPWLRYLERRRPELYGALAGGSGCAAAAGSGAAGAAGAP